MEGRKYHEGLFIARFQPFHNGHKYVVEFALSQCDRLVIAVCGAQRANTINNPLDVDARTELVVAGLRDANIDPARVKILQLPDSAFFGGTAGWLRYIFGKNPNIDAIFTANESVESAFKVTGIKVVVPPEHRREELSGTNIRSLICRGGQWQRLVPEPEIPVLERHISDIKSACSAKQKASKAGKLRC